MKKYKVITRTDEKIMYQLNILTDIVDSKDFSLLECLTHWICKLDINAGLVIRNGEFKLLHDELRIAIIKRANRLECNIIKDIMSYDIYEDKDLDKFDWDKQE